MGLGLVCCHIPSISYCYFYQIGIKFHTDITQKITYGQLIFSKITFYSFTGPGNHRARTKVLIGWAESCKIIFRSQLMSVFLIHGTISDRFGS